MWYEQHCIPTTALLRDVGTQTAAKHVRDHTNGTEWRIDHLFTMGKHKCDCRRIRPVRTSLDRCIRLHAPCIYLPRGPSYLGSNG